MKATGIGVHRVATDEKCFRRVLDDVRAAPNGELDFMDERLRAFEQKYKMSSSEAFDRVQRGELPASREVEAWMMALRVRDDLAQLKARPR